MVKKKTVCSFQNMILVFFLQQQQKGTHRDLVKLNTDSHNILTVKKAV